MNELFNAGKLVIHEDDLKHKQKLESTLNDIYSRASSVWLPTLTDMKACQQQFDGNFWDATQMSYLNQTYTFDSSINIVRKLVLDLVGNVDKNFRNSLFDFPSPNYPEEEILPEDKLFNEFKTEMQKSLKYLNSIKTYYFDKGKFKDALLTAFRISLIQGYAIVHIKQDKNGVFGDVYDGFKSIVDPTSVCEDMSDCSYVIIEKESTKSKLMALYPDSAEDIANAGLGANNRTLYATPQPSYSESVIYREYWLRTAENLINQYDGNIYVVKTLASSGKILSIERVDYSVLPFVLVAPIINQSASTLIDRYPNFSKNLWGIQKVINDLSILMQTAMTHVPQNILLVRSDKLKNKDSLSRGMLSGVQEVLSDATDISQIVHRIEPTTAYDSIISSIQTFIDKTYEVCGMTSGNLGTKGVSNETASLLEIKNIEEDTATHSYKSTVFKALDSLINKMTFMVLQCSIAGSHELMEKDDDENPFDVDAVFDRICSNEDRMCITDLSQICGRLLGVKDLKKLFIVLKKCTVTFGYGIDSPVDRDREFIKLKDIQASFGYQIPIEMIARASGISDPDLLVLLVQQVQAQAQAQQMPLQAPVEANQQSIEEEIPGSLLPNTEETGEYINNEPNQILS